MLSWMIWVIVGLAGLLVVWLVPIKIIKQFIDIPFPVWMARFIDNPLRRRLQPPHVVVAWMSIEEDMSVLEIGPGPGTFTVEAFKQVGSEGKLHVVDVNPQMLQEMRVTMAKRGISGVRSQVAPAERLPYPDDYFDRVFLIAVFGEIRDRAKALLEIRRVVKPDGLVAIGEFLPDPDFPLPSTVIGLCERAGLDLVRQHGRLVHYLLLFAPRN